MTVRECVGLLSQGTDYELVSVYTRKQLAGVYDKEKKEKYLDCQASNVPFYANLYAASGRIRKANIEWVKPIISIWVLSE